MDRKAALAIHTAIKILWNIQTMKRELQTAIPTEANIKTEKESESAVKPPNYLNCNRRCS